MTFLIILIALSIERFFDWSHLRQFAWFTLYQRKVSNSFPTLSPYWVLAITILPLLAVVGVIEIGVDGLLYGFMRFVFELVILIYCFGPQNLWADAFSCINVLRKGDQNRSMDTLKVSFDVSEIAYSQSLHRYLLDHIFIEANRRLFAVIFWYVILGPLGAVLYRAVALSAQSATRQESLQAVSQSATLIEGMLDWLPVRLFTFIFALGGHYVEVFSCWYRYFLFGLSNNETLLTECGIAALGFDAKGSISETDAAERTISLLDRALIIVLVLVALFSWVF